MLSSDSGAPSQLPLQIPQSNNENNRGIIGNGSHNFVNSGNIINSVIEINDSEDELERLLSRYVSKDALRDSFYSPPECHPNTRTTVRNEIGEWIDESGSEKSPLLWLNGPAAVGKSVIAKTISGFHEQIVATFFFSTSSDKNAVTLFPTLAWQLAWRIPDTRKHIIASLKKGGSPQTSQIEEQFNLLIIQPLKSTTTLRSRPVMVIDGVDECIDESMLVRFLQVLVRAGKDHDGGMPVRFVICSRPEPRIHAILVRDVDTTHGQEQPIILEARNVLQKIGLEGTRDYRTPYLNIPIQRRARPDSSSRPLQEFWQMYRPIRFSVDRGTPSSETRDELRAKSADTLDRIHTGTVISTIQLGFSEECKEDIARYLTDKFNAIRQPGEGTSPWFQPSDISDLVEASCGQFLYASTIVRLLDEPHFDPRDVLEMARRSFLPTPDLNKLYKAVLKRVEDTIRNQAKEGGPDCRTEWRFVMDSLVVLVFFAGNLHFITARNNFPVIEVLLGLEKGKLTLKLSKMHSVLRILPGETIELHHRSFLEFLQSRERSGEYYIANSYALWRILILMFRAGIRYNIMLYRGQFKENEQVMLQHVQDMIDAFRPDSGKIRAVPHALHLLIHGFLMLSLHVSCLFLSMRHLPYSPSTFPVILIFLSIIFFSLIWPGAFILSLTTYTLFFNRFIIVPFFHPFLHPLLVATGGFFFPMRLVVGVLPLFIVGALLVVGLPQWLS